MHTAVYSRHTALFKTFFLQPTESYLLPPAPGHVKNARAAVRWPDAVQIALQQAEGS